MLRLDKLREELTDPSGVGEIDPELLMLLPGDAGDKLEFEDDNGGFETATAAAISEVAAAGGERHLSQVHFFRVVKGTPGRSKRARTDIDTSIPLHYTAIARHHLVRVDMGVHEATVMLQADSCSSASQETAMLFGGGSAVHNMHKWQQKSDLVYLNTGAAGAAPGWQERSMALRACVTAQAGVVLHRPAIAVCVRSGVAMTDMTGWELVSVLESKGWQPRVAKSAAGVDPFLTSRKCEKF